MTEKNGKDALDPATNNTSGEGAPSWVVVEEANETTSLTTAEKHKKRFHKPYKTTKTSFTDFDPVIEDFLDDVSSVEEGRSRPRPTEHLEFGEVYRDNLHRFFIFYQSLTIVVSFCLLASQVFMIVFKSKMGAIQLSLRCYCAIFAIFSVFNEFEIPGLIKSSSLTNWCLKGFLYSFLGVLGLEESILVNLKSSKIADSNYVQLFVVWSSFAMVWLGSGYFVMGILCAKSARDRRVAKFTTQTRQRALRLAMAEEHRLHENDNK